MFLLPVGNAGKRCFADQLIPANPHTHGAKADGFSRIADAHHGYAFTGDVASVAKGLKGIMFSVVPGDHAQAGRPAVHGVVLLVEGKFGHENKQTLLITGIKLRKI